MKKIIAIMLALVLMLSLAACGGNQVITNNGNDNKNNTANANTSTNNTTNTDKPADNKAEKIEFGGQNVYPGGSFDATKVSEEAKVMEIPSCALEGTDTVYTYGDVEVTVGTYKGEQVIYSTYFISPNMKTEKGLSLGDKKADMEGAYGTEYKNNGSLYEYSLGDATLSFTIENDTITSIFYTLITE